MTLAGAKLVVVELVATELDVVALAGAELDIVAPLVLAKVGVVVALDLEDGDDEDVED